MSPCNVLRVLSSDTLPSEELSNARTSCTLAVRPRFASASLSRAARSFADSCTSRIRGEPSSSDTDLTIQLDFFQTVFHPKSQPCTRPCRYAHGSISCAHASTPFPPDRVSRPPSNCRCPIREQGQKRRRPSSEPSPHALHHPSTRRMHTTPAPWPLRPTTTSMSSSCRLPHKQVFRLPTTGSKFLIALNHRNPNALRRATSY